MGNKFLNASVFITQLLIVALCATIEIKGFVVSISFQQEITFILSLVRLGMLLLFTASYYKNSLSEGSAGNIFIACFLFSSTLSEIKVFNYFENLTSISYISQVVLSRISIFAVLTMFLSLIGAGLFSQNNKHGEVFLFSWLSLACAIALGFILPIPLVYENLWNMTPSFWIVTLLSAIAFISNIILLFFESSGTGKTRAVASLLFVLSIVFMWLLKIQYATIVGSLLFILGCLLEIVLLTRNYVRL